MQFSTAVTTCPRENVSYLTKTMKSLHAAGFLPHIHDDSGKEGSYPAFQNALRVAVESDPDSDAVIVFQDDLLASGGLCEWLGNNLWPEPVENIGCVSLYTAGVFESDYPGWHRFNKTKGNSFWGGLGLMFPMESAKAFLADPIPGSLTRTDYWVSEWCRIRAKSFWLHTPSFIRHTGDKSAISDVWDKMTPEMNPQMPVIRNCRTWCQDVSELS